MDGNPLTPNPALLAKLGSILVHFEESTSENGHFFDKVAISSLMEDSEVKLWIEQMRELALLPVKRANPEISPEMRKKRS